MNPAIRSLTSILLVLAAGLPSVSVASGCDATGPASGTYTMDQPGQPGLSRNYRLHVPTGYTGSSAMPLVAIFHGWGGNEHDFLANQHVTALADQRGYILVAPRGLGSGAPDEKANSWSFSGSTTGLDGSGAAATCDTGITPEYRYPSCQLPASNPIAKNSCAWTHCQADDVAFVLALVKKLESELCVDSARVFATGGSNGGMFAWELGQNPRSAPTFRAIAPLIGLPHRGYLGAPAKAVPMPVLLITGTSDPTVPPGGWEDDSFTTTSNDDDRFYYASATAITRSWANANGCPVGADALPFDDGNSETDCRSYCTGYAPAWPRVLDCRANMGHVYALEWSWRLILDFFDRHST